MNDLIYIEEPKLLFGLNQKIEDPRDGLTLFGPINDKSPFGINYGVVGTEAGIERFYRWIKSVNNFIAHPQVSKRNLWIPFPGFNEVFRIPFAKRALYEKQIDSKSLKEILKTEGDSFQRVYKIVSLYENIIAGLDKNSDENINIWFVVSPESIYHDCRPKSLIADPKVKISGDVIRKRKEKAKEHRGGQDFLFEGQEGDYYAYEFDNDFRRQLKARRIMNNAKAPVQILRESTLTPDDFKGKWGERIRDIQPESQVAWNLLSTVFYKCGGKPWRLSGIRDGVCYLGLVYKKLNSNENDRSSCCAAQMFLDSGDGVVFNGAVGPWKSGKYEEYHIDKKSAEDIIKKAVSSYEGLMGPGKLPKEIFIFNQIDFRRVLLPVFEKIILNLIS